MKTKTTVNRETFTITFERAIESTREDVFDAWTDPEQVKLWWDPTGTPLSECTIDLRPGGAFRFTNASHHGPPFEGVYRLIERPSQLVFDALGAVGTVRLGEESSLTRMVVTIRCASEAHLDQFVSLGVADGTDRTLDNLVVHAQRRREAS